MLIATPTLASSTTEMALATVLALPVNNAGTVSPELYLQNDISLNLKFIKKSLNVKIINHYILFIAYEDFHKEKSLKHASNRNKRSEL